MSTTEDQVPLYRHRVQIALAKGQRIAESMGHAADADALTLLRSGYPRPNITAYRLALIQSLSWEAAHCSRMSIVNREAGRLDTAIAFQEAGRILSDRVLRAREHYIQSERSTRLMLEAAELLPMALLRAANSVGTLFTGSLRAAIKATQDKERGR